MSINKQQIKDLLGNGLTITVVANAVGCDASYISQLLSDDVFAAEVSEKRTKALTADTIRDTTIDGIEDRLLSKLSEVVDDGAFVRPRDLLSAVAIVNKLNRRGKPIHQGINPGTINNIVNISLPPQVQRRFATNTVNEVIEVEGRTLVTMTAHQLLKNLAQSSLGAPSQEKQSDRYLKALSHLPTELSGEDVSDT